MLIDLINWWNWKFVRLYIAKGCMIVQAQTRQGSRRSQRSRRRWRETVYLHSPFSWFFFVFFYFAFQLTSLLNVAIKTQQKSLPFGARLITGLAVEFLWIMALVKSRHVFFYIHVYYSQRRCRRRRRYHRRRRRLHSLSSHWPSSCCSNIINCNNWISQFQLNSAPIHSKENLLFNWLHRHCNIDCTVATQRVANFNRNIVKWYLSGGIN